MVAPKREGGRELGASDCAVLSYFAGGIPALPIVAADKPTSSRSPRLTLAIYRTTADGGDGGAFATRGQLLVLGFAFSISV